MPGLWSGRVGEGAALIDFLVCQKGSQEVTSELSPQGSEVSGAHMENRSNPGGRRERCEQRSDLSHFVSLPNRSFPCLSN